MVSEAAALIVRRARAPQQPELLSGTHSSPFLLRILIWKRGSQRSRIQHAYLGAIDVVLVKMADFRLYEARHGTEISMSLANLVKIFPRARSLLLVRTRSSVSMMPVNSA